MPKHAGDVAAANGNPFTASPPESGPVWDDILLRLTLAAGFGIAASLAYFLTSRKSRSEAASFVATMTLLAILLGMVSMVIGSNIARAFALVGALSIVRFRTVVEDTRDTAFVIFAVVVGMAAGAGAYIVAAVGIPIVGVVAWLLALWGRSGEANRGRPRATRVVVRIGTGVDPATAVAAVLGKHATTVSLIGVSTTRQGTALDLAYSLMLREAGPPLALIGELNRTEGVQGVEWAASGTAEKK